MDARTARKRVWGWWMFDFANQPYSTLLMTFIFAPYFASAVASDPTQGQQYWGWMLAISGLFIAALAPILGAIADSAGPRRPWLYVFSVMYVIGAAGLWVAVPDSENVVLVLLLFAIGMMGLDFGIIFTNAHLPELGKREELGAISGSGWAVGYAGGVLALVVMLLVFAENEAGVTLLGNPPPFGLDAEAREGTRMVGPLSALWYVVFALPFFLWVPDVPRKPRIVGAVAEGLRGLGRTLRQLPRNRSLAAYLGSSMLYRDGLNGIFAFGGIYAAGVLGWSIVQIGVFGILAALVGIVGCWVGGRADRRLGPKPVIQACILALILVCTIIVTTSREMVLLVPVAEGSTLPDIVFYICGGLIGAAGGAVQAASRTMMVRQADPARMTEAFGLYALSGKAVSFLAPALVALATQITGSQRLGVAPIILLFLAGLFVLRWVNAEGAPQPARPTMREHPA